MNAEKMLSVKLCSILGINKPDNKEQESSSKEMKLMEKSELDTMAHLIKELLLCSVMTRSNTLEPLLKLMMDSLVSATNQLTANSALVPVEFYLPAPPIFCAQMEINSEVVNETIQIENNLRIRLYVLCKCIIVLLISSKYFDLKIKLIN